MLVINPIVITSSFYAYNRKLYLFRNAADSSGDEAPLKSQRANFDQSQSQIIIVSLASDCSKMRHMTQFWPMRSLPEGLLRKFFSLLKKGTEKSSRFLWKSWSSIVSLKLLQSFYLHERSQPEDVANTQRSVQLSKLEKQPELLDYASLKPISSEFLSMSTNDTYVCLS